MKNLFILFIFSLFSLPLFSKEPISRARLDQLSGARRSTYDDKSTWDQRYSGRSFVYGKLPSKFLSENYYYLKAGSTVLDMGMGEGRNAVFLAQKGFKVTGIDISSVAVKKANILAKEYNVRIKTVVASLEKYPIEKESFDSIICFYYVNRELLEKMKEWLKPGGVIVFEAYTLKQKHLDKKFNKEADSSFVKEQELLSLFKDFKILKFEEPEHEKEYRSSIIVQKK